MSTTTRVTAAGAGLLDTGRAVASVARRAEITFLGAAIAYYGLVSIVPALVLVLAIASSLGGVALADRGIAVIGHLLTSDGEAVLEDALTGADNRIGATALGLLVLGWGASKGFRGLDTAFSRVYGTSGQASLLERLRDAAVGLLAVGLAFLGMVLLGGILAALPVPPVGWFGGLVGLLGGLFVAFLPLYTLFPDAAVGVEEAAPGAAVAAVGWLALQAAFQLYTALTSVGDLYGVLGGVLLLVTWFYLAAVLILVGAALNVALAGRDLARDRQAEGSPGRGPP